MTRPVDLRWGAFRSDGGFEPNLRHLQENIPFVVGLGGPRPVQTFVREISKFLRRQGTPPELLRIFCPLT